MEADVLNIKPISSFFFNSGLIRLAERFVLLFFQRLVHGASPYHLIKQQHSTTDLRIVRGCGSATINPTPGSGTMPCHQMPCLLRRRQFLTCFTCICLSFVAFITLPNLSLSALSLSHGLSGVDINLWASYRLAGLATFGRSSTSPPYCR